MLTYVNICEFWKFSKKNNFSQKNNVSFGQKSFTTAAQYMTKPAASKSQVTDSLSNKRVFHQKFGYGAIISADGNKLEIQFEKAGKRAAFQLPINGCECEYGHPRQGGIGATF